MTKQPSSDVTITLDYDVGNITTVPERLGSLTFTPSNWDTPQQVVVKVVDDSIPEGNHFAVVTHHVNSGDPDYQDIGKFTLDLPISDNEAPEVLVLPSSKQLDVVEPTIETKIFEGNVISATAKTLTFAKTPGDLSERGFNGSLSQAMDLDSADWSLRSDSQIGYSTSYPHVTIHGTGDNTNDYYKFTITSAMIDAADGGDEKKKTASCAHTSDPVSVLIVD